MQINVVSWDGHSLNDSSYFARIPRLENMADSEALSVERSGEYPVYAGKRLAGKYFGILVQMKGTPATSIDTLKTWFDTKHPTLKKLVVSDPNNSDKQWYLDCACVSNPTISGKVAEFQLYAPDPVLKAVTATTVTWSVTATGQTQAVTAGGNIAAKPIITITPTSAKSGGYGFKRFITLKNVHTTGAFTDYPIELTNGGLDTATLIGASKMQADGDDLRIILDGAEAPRWLQDINAAATKVWININLAKKQTTTLKTGILITGTVPTIYLAVNATSKIFMSGIKSTGGIVEIGTELFTYTGIDRPTYTLTGCVRATKGSSAAAHAIADTITWIEHDLWMMYGNSSVDAPVQSETKKPIIALTSTNDSWVYADFFDETGLRTGGWKPSNVSSTGKTSSYYTADHDTEADPASEMGMSIKAYNASGRWKAESANIQWTLYHPAGITHVSSNGEQYRNSVSWPTTAALQKGSTTARYYNVWNLTTGTLSTWDTWTKAAQALAATYNYLRFVLTGVVGATADAVANIEVEAATLTIDSAKRPSVSLGAEQANYWLDLTLTNNTTAEWVKISYLMALNTSLVLDCENKTLVYNAGDNALGALSFSSIRQDWLNLSVGSNTLQYDDTGTDAVTVGITFSDRNN